MGSISNPNSLNSNYKDCSQSICTIYCPQWCYFVFPPPPPDTPFADSPVSSARPLIIVTIIGILASIFLLMTIVYIIISKCCPPPVIDQELAVNVRDNDELAAYLSSGLDEASIKLIAIVKYRKEDVKDCCCSVCLSEFEEGETLRVLPKCSHVFHVPCIDTWLASHSSCPLCRSEIIVTANREDFVPVDYRYEHDSTTAATVVVQVQQHQHSVDISLSVEEPNTECYQQ